MEMLKRFALVIHWVSFVSGILFGLLLIGLSMTPDFSNAGTEIFQRVLLFFLGLFSFFAFSGLGWLSRFVLIGKVHFLPWKKLND